MNLNELTSNNLILFIFFAVIILILHALIWIKIFQNTGYDGKMSLIIVAILSFFIFGSSYGLIVMVAMLLFLAITKWPIHEELEAIKKKEGKKSEKKKK